MRRRDFGRLSVKDFTARKAIDVTHHFCEDKKDWKTPEEAKSNFQQKEDSEGG